MSWRTFLDSALPPITPFIMSELKPKLTYIGAAGFEPRAISFLEEAIKENMTVDNAIAIKYEPIADGNMEAEVDKRLSAIGAKYVWQVFDRFDPQTFSKSIFQPLENAGNNHILVDVSAMSKFLIMVLLNSMRFNSNQVTIVYTEAGIYHPTRDKFEQERQIRVVPDFLTTDVYKITSVSSLSSVAMQGHPVLMIVFPTFNHFDLAALYNEFSPKYLILLEGDPHDEKDKWRLDAIKYVNESVTSNLDYSQFEYKRLSTFEYTDTVRALEEIYRNYSYTHKILLAPTGSKLQTIASLMFRLMHPDVQIVYPASRSFSEDKYTKKCKKIWSIRFDNFANFASNLDSFRREI